MHGGDNHGDHNGFTALGKKIGTSKSTETDTDYVTEHRVLKYLRNKIAHYLHDTATTGLLGLGFIRQTRNTISFVGFRSDG